MTPSQQALNPEELKVCPFCGAEQGARTGGPKLMQSDSGQGWTIRCTHCLSRGGQVFLEAEAIEAWNTRALSLPPDGWRGALQTIAEGDEPRPVGEAWYPNGMPSKHDKCTHGIWMYETCGNCIAEFAAAALLPPPPKEMG